MTINTDSDTMLKNIKLMLKNTDNNGNYNVVMSQDYMVALIYVLELAQQCFIERGETMISIKNYDELDTIKKSANIAMMLRSFLLKHGGIGEPDSDIKN
jgi:hypothetical protein